MRTVLMVLFDQVQSLDVTGPLEVFTGANTWRAASVARHRRIGSCPCAGLPSSSPGPGCLTAGE